MKPPISIHGILQQKFTNIQERLPLSIKSSKLRSSFSDVLNDVIGKTANPEISLDTSIKMYPRVSGDYEASYPVLTAEELSVLMPRINDAIANASMKYDVDENMIRAIMKQESSFQPLALSITGAMGLMQLMPETAKLLSVADPYNIEQNTMGGTRFFKAQLDAFDGNTELALAAYNAGPNNVRKFDGIPPFTQTQKYVKNIIEYYNLYTSTKR